MAGCHWWEIRCFMGLRDDVALVSWVKFPGCHCIAVCQSTIDNYLDFLSIEDPPDGYRKKIITASRIYIPNTWQMPQGGANNGEDLRKAAIRELREETGVTSAEFLAESPYRVTYHIPIKVQNELNRDGSEMPEFKECSWRLPEQVVELAVYFQKPVYEQVLKVFSPYFSSDSDDDHSIENEPIRRDVHRQSKWSLAFLQDQAS